MFAIGDRKWPGISKLVEECGEVLQLCGKLMGKRGNTSHWNVADLKVALEDEIADVRAACRFVMIMCGLDIERIRLREDEKYAIFRKWHDDDPEPEK